MWPDETIDAHPGVGVQRGRCSLPILSAALGIRDPGGYGARLIVDRWNVRGRGLSRGPLQISGYVGFLISRRGNVWREEHHRSGPGTRGCGQDAVRSGHQRQLGGRVTEVSMARSWFFLTAFSAAILTAITMAWGGSAAQGNRYQAVCFHEDSLPLYWRGPCRYNLNNPNVAWAAAESDATAHNDAVHAGRKQASARNGCRFD